VTVAFVGIGSNLGNSIDTVRQAFVDLAGIEKTSLTKKSSLYRSAPIGYAGQPDFINAVAQLETGLPAERLLSELQEVEKRHGRERSFANAPRTLDLDLLLYGEAAIKTKNLVVPHPRMYERAFVLKPLLEISPGLKDAAAALNNCADQKVERIS
jgi:2-amino-4-hydroxy-6-hydroxymethyldihydropteridine diphosphokinase